MSATAHATGEAIRISAGARAAAQPVRAARRATVLLGSRHGRRSSAGTANDLQQTMQYDGQLRAPATQGSAIRGAVEVG
ncbi:hypothetical protein [Streptomyces sp. NPDC050560]|uniref:hypothetical protein n=1 Tax=Streptomyces sp. NPDC050560 TaxID=3365630 RepID=UPI00379F649A